jgi:hypothetical protein
MIILIIILKLESNGPVIIELYDVMLKLRNSIKHKLTEKYYGMIAQQKIKYCDNQNETDLFKRRADALHVPHRAHPEISLEKATLLTSWYIGNMESFR